MEIPSSVPGVVNEFHDVKEGYLTKDDFVKLYEKCGALMHAENPYGSKKDISYYEKNIRIWMQKIVILLNNHMVHVVNEKWFYLVHMKEEGTDEVRGYIFGDTGLRPGDIPHHQ